jgi:hypothetical protein
MIDGDALFPLDLCLSLKGCRESRVNSIIRENITDISSLVKKE